jgi:hypothetical protein
LASFIAYRVLLFARTRWDASQASIWRLGERGNSPWGRAIVRQTTDELDTVIVDLWGFVNRDGRKNLHTQIRIYEGSNGEKPSKRFRISPSIAEKISKTAGVELLEMWRTVTRRAGQHRATDGMALRNLRLCLVGVTALPSFAIDRGDDIVIKSSGLRALVGEGGFADGTLHQSK